MVAGLVGESEYTAAFVELVKPERPHISTRKLETHAGILYDALTREVPERGQAQPAPSSSLVGARTVHCYSIDPEEHRRVALCVERMGGWPKVCRMTSDTEMADRASFRAMYRSIGERQAKRQELAAVAHLADVSSRPMLGARHALRVMDGGHATRAPGADRQPRGE